MFEHNRPRFEKPARKMKKSDDVAPLQVRQLPFYRVHYLALQAYVEQVFGFEFDYLFASGVVENTAVDYDVHGTLPSDAWEKKARDLRECKRTKDTNLILNVLAHDGYIQPGRYTVSTHKLPDPTQLYRTALQHTGSPLSAQCMAIKERFKGDKVFMERASILDKAIAEATK